MPRRSSGVTARTTRISICLILLLTILSSSAAQAQLSNDLVNTPGPSGGARLTSTYYVYARNPVTNPNPGDPAIAINQVIVRSTNGDVSGKWISLPTLSTNVYPAAATIYDASLRPTKIAVFARNAATGHLMVTLTATGDSVFSAWQDLGVTTDAAPTACWLKPTTTTGGLIVFYRNLATQRCDYKISPDGVNWTAAPKTVFSTVNMQSAPTVVIRPTLNNAPSPYVLCLFYKGPSNVIYRHDTENLVNWGTNTSSDPAPDSYASRSVSSPAAAQSFDPTLTSNIGTCIVEGDPTSWLDYHLNQVNVMRAGVMKFHMTHDNEWQNGRPAQHSIPFIAIDNCISAGVKTIVFRTAETHTTVADVQHFLSTMTFPGTTNRTIAQLPDLYPTRGIEFVIEVGNEPNRVFPLFPAATARANALAVAAILKPQPQYAKFRWIVSMPTANALGQTTGQFDYTYLNEFVAPEPGSPPSTKTVLTEYQGAGVHIYTNNNLAWNNTGERPLAVLEYTLARLPYGKMIHVSEIGLNSRTLDWTAKGIRYKNAMYAAPACVHAWEIFCASAHPQWNTFTYYCLDKAYTDRQITAVTPGTSANQTFSKITFTVPTGLPLPTWAEKSSVAIKNVLLGTTKHTVNIDGNFNVLGPTTIPVGPAPGPGFFWINRDTRGLGPVLTDPPGPGWTDVYPLTTVPTFPGAFEIGKR